MENWELGAICLLTTAAIIAFVRWAFDDIDQELEDFCEDIYKEQDR